MSSKIQNVIKSKRFVWLFEIVIIIVLSFMAYGNAINNNYNVDDAYIVPLDSQNDIIKEGPKKAIPVLIKSRYNEAEGATYGYRPLGKITMAYEYKFWGNNPRNSHIVNVSLFALNIILLLFFLNMLAIIGLKIPKEVIYIGLLLFVFHPIHTEVVCSIKNREEILSFTFLIGSLMFYIQFLKRSNLFYLVPFIALLLLGLLAKQTAFTIFGWLIILPIVGARFGNIETKKIYTLIKSIGVFVLSMILYYWVFVQTPASLAPSDIAYSFEQNPYKLYGGALSIPNGIQTLFFYLKKMIIPFPLLFYYGYDMLPVQNWNMILPYVGILIILALGIYVVRSFYKKTGIEVSFWIAVFSFSIFPFSNLFKPIYITGIVGERLVYQASFAFCMLLAIGIIWLAKKQKIVSLRLFYAIFLLPVIIAYYIITSQRSLQWEDKVTLYENDIKSLSKSVHANSMIASMYMKSLKGISTSERIKKVEKAKHYFNQSVTIYPSYSEGWLKLGIIHSQYLNNLDSAILCLNNVEKDSSVSHLSSLELMGDLYGKESFNDSIALGYYTTYWSINNSENRVYQKIQNIMFNQLRYNEALFYADEAIKNGWVEGFVDKGDLLLQLGSIDSAIVSYKLAVKNGFKNPKLLQKINDLSKID